MQNYTWKKKLSSLLCIAVSALCMRAHEKKVRWTKARVGRSSCSCSNRTTSFVRGSRAYTCQGPLRAGKGRQFGAYRGHLRGGGSSRKLLTDTSCRARLAC